MRDSDAVITATRAWVQKAVIGLNLCPFAKAVEVKGQIRYVVSHAHDPQSLLEDLRHELRLLADADPSAVETTLLIHPSTLQNFLDYNDFLSVADDALKALGLRGVLQIASFHPDYRFAGAEKEDMGNYSNRSPFPILHLLREASIDAAVAAFPETEKIYQRNIETLRQLGQEGWRALGIEEKDGE